ncbi:hypothetical protein ACFSTI_20705 [Rhizorhabdus histidinilytica]|uniref:DUF2190 family protein n=1 Tax=Rhizorhabdus histidinilytica TaxID=439228 RepID=A0A1T5BNM9_9SPHN|nr:hypothetical protein [Rhizorhabdus histidinilytica]SKB48901.1 hypothetical protein SAMN06295920_103162 [Rhizorhabdus histidinilytica]
MAEVQTTYTDNLAPAYPGMIANGEVGNRITRTCEDAAGIGFGKAVYRGVGDHGCTATQTLVAAGSEAAGNVGTGTITDVPTVAAGAKIGRYTAILLATSATAAFAVNDPDGNLVGHGNVATQFSGGGLTFTISNAGTMTIGDTFYVDVTGNEFLGITIAHEALAVLPGADADEYPQYENVPILTGGAPIWVKSGANFAQGNGVHVAADGDFEPSGGIGLDGWDFDNSGTSGDLAKIVAR